MHHHFTADITKHILVIVLYSVSVTGLSFHIIMKATTEGNQGNQAILAKLVC